MLREPVPQIMMLIHLATQEVPRQPAQFVIEVGLVRKQRGAVGLAEVICLNQFGMWTYAANRCHGEDRRLALVVQRGPEFRFAVRVWIPESVQITMAPCRPGTCDGRVALDIRIVL